MADSAPRVVVLGRPGEAQQQLQHALDELGAQTLAVGDFDQLDPVQMREKQPDVWLVSMDENTDAARLERWQPLFDDPDATVIFDDADVTRRLSGWDLARWARHLAAKVLGRNDVLPPVSPDAERLPRSSAAEADEGLDMQDVGSAGPAIVDSTEQGADGVVPMKLDAVEYDATDVSPGKVELSLADDADFAALSASFDSERKQLEENSEAHPAAMALDDLLSAHSDDASDSADVGSDRDGAAQTSAAGTPPNAADVASGLSLLDMDADLSTPRAERIAAPEVGIDVSHLELAPLDAAAAPEAAPKSDMPAELETAFASTLALEPEAPPEGTIAAEPASSPKGGLIAIVAGLGGPDAVRQFLGALPVALKVPVLLWQHLDAGKHDRLAQQLGKATKLPVYLAQPGELAHAGAVGVMGTGLGVISNSGWRIEAGSASASEGLAAALNDPTTVIAILSGAEPAIVEKVRAHIANGGQALVQTASTCFDGTAASALESQGVTAGSPPDLAVLAAARWIS